MKRALPLHNSNNSSGNNSCGEGSIRNKDIKDSNNNNFSVGGGNGLDFDEDNSFLSANVRRDLRESVRCAQAVMRKKARHEKSKHAHRSRSSSKKRECEEVEGGNASDDEEEKCKVYVGNFPPFVGAQEIQDVFSSFGKIRCVDFKQGYCFVQFATCASARLVLDFKPQITIHGTLLRVGAPHRDRRGTTTDNSSNNTNSSNSGGGGGGGICADPNAVVRARWGERRGQRLYVGNLSPAVTEHSLIRLFRAYGEVRFCMLGSKEPSAHFGFVEFDRAECAEEAKRALDGQAFMGRRLKVTETREDKPIPRDAHVVFGYECLDSCDDDDGNSSNSRKAGTQNTIYLWCGGCRLEGHSTAHVIAEVRRLGSQYGVVKEVSAVSSPARQQQQEQEPQLVLKADFESFKNCK